MQKKNNSYKNNFSINFLNKKNTFKKMFYNNFRYKKKK